jgi:hypothetical protein
MEHSLSSQVREVYVNEPGLTHSQQDFNSALHVIYMYVRVCVYKSYIFVCFLAFSLSAFLNGSPLLLTLQEIDLSALKYFFCLK